MIKWPQFRRRFCTFRTGQFNQLHSLTELDELSYGGVLHCLDNFQMIGKVNYAPALDNPIINLNNYKLYISNVIGPEKFKRTTDVCDVDMTKILLVNAGVQKYLLDYRRSMSPRVMWAESIEDLPLRASCQGVVNYNALFRARVMGVRRKVRFMNFLWSMIINTIMRAPEKMHFIHIPLESLQFEKKDFIRVFKKFDRVATVYPEISSYLFLAHFYAILAKRVNLPKRGAVDEDPEGAVESFAIDPSTYDPDLTDTEILNFLSSSMLEDNNLEASMEALKEGENPYKNSIFEFIPPRYYENINFLLTCGGKFICYNLRDLKELNAGGNALIRVIKHVNSLAACGVPQEMPQENEAPMVSEKITSVNVEEDKPNQAIFVEPMTLKEKEDAADADLHDLDDIEKIINETQLKRDKAKPLTPAQTEHIKVIGKAYKKLVIGGKTFEQIMTDVSGDFPDIPTVDLPAVKDGSLDKEATKSTTAMMDVNYVKNSFDRDIAAILTSFNKQGMFIVDFKEEDAVDELNSKKTYTAQFEDIDHKKHTVKFTIPKVDAQGRFKSNGSLKVMKKQRVSNPICKVSPTRVTLNSNYNKLLVERNTNVAHNFYNWFRAYLAKATGEGHMVQFNHSNYRFPERPYPYELTDIGSKFESVKIDNAMLYCRVPDRAKYIPANVLDKVKELEQNGAGGYWFGFREDEHFFMTVEGVVVIKNLKDDSEPFYGAFEDFMEFLLGFEFRHLTEFVELTILNRTIPLIHALGLRYGLTNMLKYTGADYDVFEAGSRFEKRASDIIIKFKDKTLVVHRTPRHCALLFGGLCIYDFSEIYFEDMDTKDPYYEMLLQKKISMNLVKGINALLDLFIDPITRDVLREMREPTDIRDLLLRAVTLLTTSDHKDEASAVNFRFRGVEQMTGIVYNELAKSFAGYKNRSVGSSNRFSIQEFKIKQRIEQDQLTSNVSILNPLDDIKEYSNFSNSGSGGRSNDTFKIPDRRFTKDSIGIVSEANLDNGKVGLNAILPANPILVNSRGMAIPVKPEDLKPENILSLNTLLMPGATQDDSKRVTFSSIQSSAVVPIKESEVSRVRTGFEGIVAERCRPPFAYAAREDGVIESIDPANQVLIIKYKSGAKECLKYGTEFTNNSANGFHVDQEVEVNNFKKGDTFKRGDIITYNKQFFQADPYSKTVNWKIGVLAHVAIMDNGGTIEDASIFTAPLCKKMGWNPGHVREVVITKDTNIHKFADVGTEVTSVDPLLIWDESAVDFGGDDEGLAAILDNFNKNSAKAKHTGVIAEVDAIYKAPVSSMSPSLQKIIRHISTRKNARSAYAAGCANASDFQKSQPMLATDKVGLVDLTEDTVILRFTIKQDKGLNPGDKVFFDTCLKSVISQVYPESIMTENGQRVDACTSARGILARLITSPFVTGYANAILEKCEQDVLDIWDGKEPVDQNK